MKSIQTRAAAMLVAVFLAGSALVCATPRSMHQDSSNSSSSSAKATPIAAASSPLELAGGPVRVELSPESEEKKNLSAYLARGERIYLVLKNLATQEQPGVVYRVYIDLPAGSVPAKDDPHYAGTINFYAAARRTGPEASAPSGFRSFDVSDVLRGLQKQNLLTDNTSVTIIPATGKTNPNARPVIGRIELVTQSPPTS